MDSLLAAVARAHRLTMTTRNAGDFPLMDLVNPFDSAV